ncbi:hypothetical protein O7599_01685 [Streptomyces sp. WMMC500]|uniref:VMAP-C domain-containing protein n=1 Tax=Streptomyces sp. WMMC500 TaxID=3015154 RepID=UPI00248B4F72|nr:hypothetical protein [Streptomyces sp. WMMC500]WBB61302.1 hypothetical protein O7599_01685 [Streptomyces sp. WMMC500]
MTHALSGQSDWQRVSRLVEALERTRPMSDIELRRQCLEITGDRLSVNLVAVLRTVSAPRGQLYEVVRYLQDRRGGLRALADSIEFLAPEARSTEAFRQLVFEVPAQPALTTEELAEIRGLLTGLAGLPGLPVAELHRAARGVYERLPPGPPDVLRAFEHLMEANARADGLLPCMVYVEHLAAFAPAGPAGRLRDWNAAVATALGLLPAWEELRRTLAPVPAPDGEPTAYLAIQVEWFDVETDEYVLSSWTKEDASSAAVPGFAHYRCTGEDLESAVAEVIADGEDTLASLDIQVQVEFLLGRELIWLPVDEWATHRESGLPRPIVQHYPVVLRCLERQRDRTLQRVWNRRWRTMSDNPGDCGWQLCGGPEGIGAAGLQDILNKDTDTRVVAVALADAPRRPRTAAPHAYDVALREGIPAMLWHNDSAGGDLVHTLAEHLFDGGMIAGLPARVHEWRGTQIRGGVILLHDDPGNIYTQPTRRQSPRVMGRTER